MGDTTGPPLMIWLILEVICVAVAAMGLLLVFIELRTRADRSTLYFGTALILLCGMAGIDIWIQPYHEHFRDRLPWLKAQHVIAAIVIPVLYAYLLRLARMKATWKVRLVAWSSLAHIPLFVFGDLMLTLENDLLAPGPLYLPLYAPSLFLYIGFALFLMVRGIQASHGYERRLLTLHFWGYLAVCATAAADVIIIYAIPNEPLPSFTIAGVLGFGVFTAVVFSERLILLFRDRRQAYAKLEAAYRELETAARLGEFSRSAALINHELKKHLFKLAGSVELILNSEELSPDGRERLRHVADSFSRLDRFSRDVLALSKAETMVTKRPVALAQVMGAAALRLGPDCEESVELEDVPEDLKIAGDWARLEQVFLDLFTNSFEAQATRVWADMFRGPGTILLKIEDDGVGCVPDLLDEVFRAFYTTKPGRAGSGLGLSVVKAIVEAHGGHVSAYTKNRAGSDEHGMVFMLTFPMPESEAKAKAPATEPPGVVLVSEGMPDLGRVLRVFQNARVCPRIVETVADIGTGHAPHDEITVVGDVEVGERISAEFPRSGSVHLIRIESGSLYAADARDGDTRAFTEEYVLSDLVEYPTA